MLKIIVSQTRHTRLHFPTFKEKKKLVLSQHNDKDLFLGFSKRKWRNQLKVNSQIRPCWSLYYLLNFRMQFVVFKHIFNNYLTEVLVGVSMNSKLTLLTGHQLQLEAVALLHVSSCRNFLAVTGRNISSLGTTPPCN